VLKTIHLSIQVTVYRDTQKNWYDLFVGPMIIQVHWLIVSFRCGYNFPDSEIFVIIMWWRGYFISLDISTRVLIREYRRSKWRDSAINTTEWSMYQTIKGTIPKPRDNIATNNVW